MKKTVALSLLALAGTATAFAQRLPQTVIPSHYDLTITPDLANETFSGIETIDVNVTQPVSAVTMNDVGLTLHDIRITSGSDTVAATAAMNSADETVTLTTANALAAGPATIAFAFDGTISRQLRGLYLARTAKRKYAVTQFESTDARRAFPCFDEPAMKAAFDIALVVDKGDTAISNGRIVSDTPVGSDNHRLRFSTTPKMSSYLVAMLVGDFDCTEGGVDGIPIRVCGPPGMAAKEGQFALSAAEQSIHFYDDYYAIKYPFGKLDLIAIPDFEAGAMENAGAITFRETAIFYDPKTSVYDRQKGVASTIAHEIAHQWFGDLVTMKWWDDIWLNEGFATFMSSKPLEAWKPEWNVKLGEANGTIGSLGLDAQRATRPIRTHAETPAEINQLFDGIAYGKTASVLRMVENWLGPDTFREGIRAYLKKYSYSNAAAEDFWGTMASVTKQPVDAVMKSFVDQPGAPLLHASESCAGEKVSAALTQDRLLIRGATAPEQTWTIPVCVDGGCALVTSKTGTMTGGRCGEPLFLDKNGRGYFAIDYAPDTRNALRGNIGKLNDQERIALEGNEWLLVRTLHRDVADYLDLLRAMPRPESRQLTDSIMTHLEAINDHLVTEKTRAAWQRDVRDLLRGYAPLTWEAPERETPEQRSQRADILWAMGYLGRDPEVAAGAKRVADQYLNDPASVDTTIAGPALVIAVANGDEALYRRIRERLASAPSQELRDRYAGLLTGFRDPKLIKETIEYAYSDAVRSQDLPRLIGSLFANPEARQASWDAVTERWSQLQQSIPTSLPYVTGSLEGFCDPKSKAAIEAFFAKTPVTAANRALKRSLESIETCIAFRDFQEPSFERAMLK